MSFYTKYNQLLLKRPIATNILTTGFLFGSGDYLAQTAFEKLPNYDFPRTARAVIYGGLIFAPIGDKWYKFLNKLQPFGTKSLNSARLNTVARVAVDQLGFAPVLAVPMYFSVMTFLEMSSTPVADIRHKLSENWWSTLKVNWLVWPAFQAVNFYLVPVHLRLLSVNVISIVWNCYMSLVLNKKTEAQEAIILP